MMYKRFFSGLMAAFALLFAAPLTANEGINIVVEGKTNPTLRFNWNSGPAENKAALHSFLKACGWFDVIDRADAFYELVGHCEGNKTVVTLRCGGAPLGAWQVSGADARTAAKTLVDAVLKKLFNIDGICRTKIAFCADVADGIKEIYSCDIDGGDVTQITRYGSLCVEPCWFPGGQSIGYTKYGKGVTQIVETRLSPRVESRVLTSFAGLNTGVAISPDTSLMAMVLSPDHLVDLYVRPVHGKQLRRLTKGRSVEASPCWSPDGKQVCFVSDESGRPRIYAIGADGSGRRLLPSVGRETVTPDWSGDNKIVYCTRVGGDYTMAVLDLATGKNYRATDVKGTWESPAWGPDNRQVVCKRSDGARASLFIVDTWTGGVRQLLATKNHLSMPAWSGVQVRK